MFGRAGVVMLCVFRSTPHYIAKYNSEVSKAGEDSLTLSNEKGLVFKTFTVKRSAAAMFHGTPEFIKNYNSINLNSLRLSRRHAVERT